MNVGAGVVVGAVEGVGGGCNGGKVVGGLCGGNVVVCGVHGMW